MDNVINNEKEGYNMKKTILIIFPIIMVTLMIGCQKTPEEEIIVQKKQTEMIEAAQSNEVVQKYEEQTTGLTIQTLDAPQTYMETFKSGKLTVEVDAKVSVPACEVLPIIRVEGVDFSQEQVTKLFNYFCGDTEMYTVADEMTKDVIEEQIINLKALIAKEKNKENADPDDLERYERQLKESQEALPNAPLKYENVISDGTFKIASDIHPLTKTEVGRYTILSTFGDQKSFVARNNSDRKEAISYVREGGGGGGKALRTGANILYKNNFNNFISFGMGSKFPVDEITTAEQQPNILNISTTPMEAKQVVENVFNKLNMPMEVKNIYLIDDGFFDGNRYQDGDNYAYQVECARLVNGVSCSIIDGSATGGNIGADQFAPPASWFYENLTFLVNDNGIIKMEWASPINMMDTVVENCSLLPFSDIQDIFGKMMPIVYEYKANQSEEDKTTMYINDIELELVRISEQNSIKNGLLVPAWRFYGTEDESGQTANECFLTINAVDGSVIDTDIGY